MMYCNQFYLFQRLTAAWFSHVLLMEKNSFLRHLLISFTRKSWVLRGDKQVHIPKCSLNTNTLLLHEHVKLQTNSNPRSGLNLGPSSCEDATLPAAPPCHPLLCHEGHNKCRKSKYYHKDHPCCMLVMDLCNCVSHCNWLLSL